MEHLVRPKCGNSNPGEISVISHYIGESFQLGSVEELLFCEQCRTTYQVEEE